MYKVLVTQSCLTLCDPMDCSPPGSSVHGDSPGKNTGVGCHFLLWGIFPAQGSNSGPALQADFLLSEPPEKPWCHQRYRAVIFFYGNVLVWFWYDSDGDFIECFWECALLFNFLE